jgi:GTPase
MAMVDEVTIHIKAGKGGKGAVAFSKIPMVKGPTGGNGGRGGSVFIEGVSNLSALRQFRFKKDFFAGDGKDGRTKNQEGPAGDDLILKVPVGTIIHNLKTRQDIDVTTVGERIEIARGGKGGKGNFHFRSSLNVSPLESTPGDLGSEYDCTLELRLIADVGLIGLPNAGKSSLLNELTKAEAKVANYPFTTLEPNLGVYYSPKATHSEVPPLILADIPGLIEGASSGKGLGDKFLRHIERTKILIHCIGADNEDSAAAYDVVHAELQAHNAALIKKQEYIFLTKSDLLTPEQLKEKLKELKKFKKEILTVSIHDSESLDKVRLFLNEINK